MVPTISRNNGVMHLMRNTGASKSRRKVLVHRATGQVMTSYEVLEQILIGLGWERYDAGDSAPLFLQFHKASSVDLISLPPDFAKFNSIHMYDIVVKNPNIFLVREI